jgi:hypothetical protein
MSFLVQRQVGTGHVQHSAYDKPEEALAAAITLMAQGVMVVHIIDRSDHVFTPHRFAKEVRRLMERRHPTATPDVVAAKPSRGRMMRLQPGAGQSGTLDVEQKFSPRSGG